MAFQISQFSLSAASGLTELSLQKALCLASVSGILTHLYLRNYEPASTKSPFVLLFLLATPCFGSIVFIKHFASPFIRFSIFALVYWGSLTASVVLYRLSPWHPLGKIPGPLALRISKLWGTVLARRGKGHHEFKRLHDLYGPIIRVGPNEISVVDVNALSQILGTNGMPKGPIWDGRSPPDGLPNLETLRNVEEHHRRRKVWNRAFTTAAVKNYEEAVVKRSTQLLDALISDSSTNKTVNLAKWFCYFTFDFMGDMLFGGGFELIRDGDKDGVLHAMMKVMKPLSMIQHVPWFTALIKKLPLKPSGVTNFRKFAMKCVCDRRARGAVTKDVFHYIMNEDGVDKVPLALPEVLSDAGLAVVAGSDTTSSTMTVLFYYLVSHPKAYSRLRKEVLSVFPVHEGYPFDASKLASMQYLNATINEALRLQPPLPVYLQRAPQGGSGRTCIASHFIPEGTAINVSPYVLHRDPRYFSPKPDEFIPERWLKADEDNEASKFTTNVQAFIPFSMGPSNCVGKNLALLEMRMVTALLVQQLDFEFASGFDTAGWEEAIEEFFVIKPPPLLISIARAHRVSN